MLKLNIPSNYFFKRVSPSSILLHRRMFKLCSPAFQFHTPFVFIWHAFPFWPPSCLSAFPSPACRINGIYYFLVTRWLLCGNFSNRTRRSPEKQQTITADKDKVQALSSHRDSGVGCGELSQTQVVGHLDRAVLWDPETESEAGPSTSDLAWPGSFSSFRQICWASDKALGTAPCLAFKFKFITPDKSRRLAGEMGRA